MLAALQATMSRSTRSTLVFIDNRSDRPLQLLHCDTGAGRCVKNDSDSPAWPFRLLDESRLSGGQPKRPAV
eukprot:COSAG01_NODE_7067_length_3368_cov_12.018748_6_plen_71_part_00